MTAAIIVDDGDDDGGECGVGGHLSGHLDGLGSSVGLGELGCFRILSHFGSHRSLHIAFVCVCVWGAKIQLFVSGNLVTSSYICL